MQKYDDWLRLTKREKEKNAVTMQNSFATNGQVVNLENTKMENTDNN